ncbi:MAG: hypothetical protein ABIQ40_15595 [Bacteroidia bacterium]
MVIMQHCLERFDSGHHSYIVFLLAGIIFLAVAIFHHKLVHRFPKVDTLFYTIEGCLSFIIAYEYFEAGKKFLPYLYIIAGLFQLVAIFIFARKKKI